MCAETISNPHARHVRGEGLGARAIHRLLRCRTAWRPSFRRKRRRGDGEHVHDRASQGQRFVSTVLIVEDEKHLAEGLRFNLEAEGYNVEVSSDGETALALLLSPNCRFDMVVLDVMLPGKSGFEIAAELRQAGQLVPLLICAAPEPPA